MILSSQPNKRLPNNSILEIDGLRAVAVISVMLFHLNPIILPGGFSGVDVFFVISGFVVTASLLRHEGDSFLKFASDFYARRILRIFPALVVCLLVTTLFKVLFIPESWLSQSIRNTALSAFFGIGNIGLLLSSDGYFSPRMDFNPFMQTWSLGVEEQFYLLYPLLLFLWLIWYNAGSIKSGTARLLMVGLGTASLLFAAYQTPTAQEAAYLLLPSRFWELAAGAILCLSYYRGSRLLFGAKSSDLKLWFGLGLTIIGLFLSQEKQFPFPWALFSVLGTTFMLTGIISSSGQTNWIKRFLASFPMLWVGRRSYSLYLWHWPVFTLMRWTVGIESIWMALLGLSLSFLLGHLSYRWVETPFRDRHQFKNVATHRIILSGLVVICAAAFVSLLIFRGEPRITLSQTRDRRNWYPETFNDNISSSGRFNGRTIFALGDSHAGAYTTMLSMIQERHGARVVIIGGGGQSLANLLKPSEKPLKELEWYQQELERLRSEVRPGDIVFLASLRMNRLCDQWGPFNDQEIFQNQNGPNAIENQKKALEEAKTILQDLSKFPVTVIIDAPKPILAAPPFRCSDWFNRMNPAGVKGLSISREELQTRRAPVMASLKILQVKFSGLVVWDPFNTLCSGPTFHAFDGNLPILFDGDHLSGHGNRMLYPEFEALLISLWAL
jgi:peptidoglycan/LPS O-acetylase OafA/YrhL